MGYEYESTNTEMLSISKWNNEMKKTKQKQQQQQSQLGDQSTDTVLCTDIADQYDTVTMIKIKQKIKTLIALTK